MKSEVETKGLIFNNLILKTMKKIGKIVFNSDKLMKTEELTKIRGGQGYVKCMIGSLPCGDWYGGPVGDCTMASEACDIICPGNWDNAICVG